MNVQTHPLHDAIDKKISGIKSVPFSQQKKMINRAIKIIMLSLDLSKDNAVKYLIELYQKYDIEIVKIIKVHYG